MPKKALKKKRAYQARMREEAAANRINRADGLFTDAKLASDRMAIAGHIKGARS